jgi:hypothetical protein
MFTFIVDHKLSVVKVVLGLMQSIWSKVLGFRIISSWKYIIFMQFFWFFLSWTSDSLKTGEDFGSGFFWSNHQTGLVFKTMTKTAKSCPWKPSSGSTVWAWKAQETIAGPELVKDAAHDDSQPSLLHCPSTGDSRRRRALEQKAKVELSTEKPPLLFSCITKLKRRKIQGCSELAARFQFTGLAAEAEMAVPHHGLNLRCTAAVLSNGSQERLAQ